MSTFESLDEIRTFVCVIDHKSLSAAARALRVTVNAVWGRLSRIEARAGTKLVSRTTRALHVTPAGERLAVHARRILEELDGLEQEVASPATGLRGAVRVALASDVATPHFIAEIGEMLRNNPDLHVELSARSRLIDPVAAGVDLMLWVGPEMPQSATVRKLGTLRWALAAAPSYVARHGLPATPDELAEHACLLALKGKKEATFRLVDTAGVARTVPVQGRFEADLPSILLTALHLGLGVGLRPLHEVLLGVRTGQLVQVLPDYHLEPMEIALVSPAGRLKVPAVRAVAEALTRELRRQTGQG
ncbi:MAG: LysR family transcriptional regulator [Byssovorax sp.]